MHALTTHQLSCSLTQILFLLLLLFLLSCTASSHHTHTHTQAHPLSLHLHFTTYGTDGTRPPRLSSLYCRHPSSPFPGFPLPPTVTPNHAIHTLTFHQRSLFYTFARRSKTRGRRPRGRSPRGENKHYHHHRPRTAQASPVMHYRDAMRCAM